MYIKNIYGINMGTHSLTQVQENGKPLITVYTQYDGYPSHVGRQIANCFLKENPDPVNIKHWNYWNDASNLAAMILASIMEGNIYKSPTAGHVVSGYNVYIIPNEEFDNQPVSYEYVVNIIGRDKVTISVNNSSRMSIEDFNIYIDNYIKKYDN